MRYDPEHKAVGDDYPDWPDVSRTLCGEYGSRATLSIPLHGHGRAKQRGLPHA